MQVKRDLPADGSIHIYTEVLAYLKKQTKTAPGRLQTYARDPKRSESRDRRGGLLLEVLRSQDEHLGGAYYAMIWEAIRDPRNSDRVKKLLELLHETAFALLDVPGETGLPRITHSPAPPKVTLFGSKAKDPS